jgi:TonB family protein
MKPKSQWVCVVVLVFLATMSGQEAHERCLVSMPTYPPLARMAHIEGQVIVQAEVDKDGNVVSAVSSPVPGEPRGIPLLRPEALKAVRSWKLTAADASDTVPFKTSVAVDFKLETDVKGDARG